MSDNQWIPLACPECESKRFVVVASFPPKARCSDCGTLYVIPTIPDPAFEASEKKRRKTRTAAPGVRHRRDNGPQELEVEAVPPPDLQEIGTLTRYTHEILSGGPRALIAAQHKAAKLAAKFGEDFEAEWCLATPFILQLANGIDPTKSDPSAAPNGAAAHPPDSPSSGTPNTSHSNYSMEARNRAPACGTR